MGDGELEKVKKPITCAAVALGQMLITPSRIRAVLAQFVHHQRHLRKLKGQLDFLKTSSVTEPSAITRSAKQTAAAHANPADANGLNQSDMMGINGAGEIRCSQLNKDRFGEKKSQTCLKCVDSEKT